MPAINKWLKFKDFLASKIGSFGVFRILGIGGFRAVGLSILELRVYG